MKKYFAFVTSMRRRVWLMPIGCGLLYASCSNPDQPVDPIRAEQDQQPDSVVEVFINPDTLAPEAYLAYIDSLVANGMSEAVKSDPVCGGELTAHYHQGALLFLTATQTESYGFTRRDCYFRDTALFLIVETIYAPRPAWGIPQPDHEPETDGDPPIYCTEVRTVVLPQREMTIVRDGQEIFYYPESHDHYLMENIRCAGEMQVVVAEE